MNLPTELDIQVSERVLGRPVCKCPKDEETGWSIHGHNWDGYGLPTPINACWSCKRLKASVWSQNIALAWKAGAYARQRMKDSGLFDLAYLDVSVGDGEASARFSGSSVKFYEWSAELYADTPEEAICRASLEVVAFLEEQCTQS